MIDPRVYMKGEGGEIFLPQMLWTVGHSLNSSSLPAQISTHPAHAKGAKLSPRMGHFPLNRAPNLSCVEGRVSFHSIPGRALECIMPKSKGVQVPAELVISAQRDGHSPPPYGFLWKNIACSISTTFLSPLLLPWLLLLSAC